MTELAWHHHFFTNMFVRQTEEELETFTPDLTIVKTVAPSLSSGRRKANGNKFTTASQKFQTRQRGRLERCNITNCIDVKVGHECALIRET